MSALEELCGRRAQEAADGLLAVLAPLVSSPGGRARVPGVVVELLGALQVRAETVSLNRNGAVEPGTLVDVRAWGSPREAAEAVGLSERRVQQLCAAGLVLHRPVGRRGYLVCIDDVHRYIGDAA